MYVQVVDQRANVFSVFLVIPAGFLRALASKQVEVDEDGDSDDDSEVGELQGEAPAQQQQQQAETTKVRVLWCDVRRLLAQMITLASTV